MKIYLLLLCLGCIVSANAQKHSVSINYKPSLTYFGKQSQSFQHPYFASRRGDQTFHSTVNILYKQNLASRVSFTTGMEYAQQGQNINFNADSVSPSNNRQILKVELNYFRIPLTVSYSIFQKKKSVLDIYSGISLGLVAKRRDNYQELILERLVLPTPEKRYKNRDWAIPIGTNYRRNISSKVSFNFGFEYLFGLTNAFSKHAGAKHGVLSEFENSKQRRLALNMGISFELSK